jgi:hypothetical protein
VENIQDDFRIAVHQHDVSSNYDAFAIGRWRGKSALQFDGNDIHPLFQTGGQPAVNHELSLQAGGQAIPFGETAWEVSVIFAVPHANFVAVMLRESVASAVVIIVTVLMLVPVMSIAMTLRKNCVSRKSQESESDDRKPFRSFQEFPPKGVG